MYHPSTYIANRFGFWRPRHCKKYIPARLTRQPRKSLCIRPHGLCSSLQKGHSHSTLYLKTTTLPSLYPRKEITSPVPDSPASERKAIHEKGIVTAFQLQPSFKIILIPSIIFILFYPSNVTFIMYYNASYRA